MKRLSRLLVLLAFALSAHACHKATAPLADSGPAASPDAGRTEPSPDSGTASPDAAETPDVGAAADAGAPPDASIAADAGSVRTLIDRPLFGQMPIENLVMDPEFDLSAGNWYGFLAQGTLAALHKHYEALTPTGQAVLMVPKGPDNIGQVYITGTAQSAGGPISASVWIGRKEGDSTSSVSVALLTVTATGAPAGADLAVDPLAPPQKLEGLVWKRYGATIRDPSVGWVHFFLTDQSADPFYMTGPVVLPARAAIERSAGFSGWRPARSLEKKALESFNEQMKQRFRGSRRSVH